MALDALPQINGTRGGWASSGSTIGNLEPADATAFLRRARRLLGDDGALVVGADLKKDRAACTMPTTTRRASRRPSRSTCCGA